MWEYSSARSTGQESGDGGHGDCRFIMDPSEPNKEPK